LDPSTVQAGIRRGLLWTAAFGVAAGVLAALSIIAGVDVTSMILPGVPSGREEILAMFLAVGVAAPVSEEIFFRGILYGFFRRWGILAAVAANTLLFAAAHTSGGGFPLIPAAGGIALSLLYEKEKNLLVPAVVHVLGNLSLVAGGLLPRLLH
jgi:membrane protease YdiL (CAAX protease family)